MITESPIKRKRGQRGPGKPRPEKVGILTDAAILDQLKDGRPYTLPNGTEIRLEPQPPMLRAIASRMRWLHRFGGDLGKAMAAKMGDRFDRLILRITQEGQQRIMPDGSVLRLDMSGAMLGVVVARLAAVERGVGVEPKTPVSLEEQFRQNAKRALSRGSESAAGFLGGGPMKFRPPADGDADAEDGDAASQETA